VGDDQLNSGLHAPIGVVDEGVGARAAGRQRHTERGERQAGPQVVVDRPADHAPAERIEHHGQEGKFLEQPHVGDVGHPQLVEPGQLQAPGQVGHHPPRVPRVGGGGHEGAAAEAEQIVRAHQPQHALVVHGPALAPHGLRQAPIAVKPLGQGELLEGVAEAGLLVPGRRVMPVSVVAPAADSRQGAHPLDRQRALRRHHRVDEREDAAAPRPSLARGGAFTCRKAPLKKSISSACSPTLRSNSAMRFAAAWSSTALGLPRRGRPRVVRAMDGTFDHRRGRLPGPPR
jgi:hypothetical protein